MKKVSVVGGSGARATCGISYKTYPDPGGLGTAKLACLAR